MPQPDLINLSAGCPTRLNLPARAFEDWWADVSPDLDLVLVAAAGNNASPWEFWPASFPWAVGVGSLDRDGQVSDFSNWGDSVDVLALGRNLVNAFPRGTLRLPGGSGPRGRADLRQPARALERNLVRGAARHRDDRGRDECAAVGEPERANGPGPGPRGHASGQDLDREAGAQRLGQPARPASAFLSPGPEHHPRRASQRTVDPHPEPDRADRDDHREDTRGVHGAGAGAVLDRFDDDGRRPCHRRRSAAAARRPGRLRTRSATTTRRSRTRACARRRRHARRRRRARGSRGSAPAAPRPRCARCSCPAPPPPVRRDRRRPAPEPWPARP